MRVPARIGKHVGTWVQREIIHDRRYDGLVKSHIFSIFVIPAKAGIQLFQIVLDSCFRRREGFSDFLRDCQIWKGVG